MKKMRLLFSLTLLSLSFFSCEKESDQDLLEISIAHNEELKNFKESGVNGVYYSDFLTSNYTTRRRCDSGLPGANNLQLCGEGNLVANVTTTTAWYILDNGPGYIDYELERLFNESCYFSYLCIRPKGPVIQEAYGEVHFEEAGSFNFETSEYDLYHYLNSSIDPAKANELKEHFICKIREYRDANLPNAVISEVNFSGDALLCNGSTTKFLKASFKLSLH